MSLKFETVSKCLKSVTDPRSDQNATTNAAVNAVADEVCRRVRGIIKEKKFRRPRGIPVVWLLYHGVARRTKWHWYIFEAEPGKMLLCRTKTSGSPLDGWHCYAFGKDRANGPRTLLLFASSVRSHGGLAKWMGDMLKNVHMLPYTRYVQMIAPNLR